MIVQEQIASESAGVAFSLNPQNNCFDEAVINANFGLGETVVAGQVTPDAFVVDKLKNKILEKKIARKDHALWLNATGGTEKRDAQNPSEPSLSDEQVLEITALAAKVEQHYGKPMDIEWAYTDGRLHLLQARPITGFFPLPETLATPPGDQKQLYVNMGLVKQGIPGLMSPMGADYFQMMGKIAASFLPEEALNDPKNGIGTFEQGTMLNQMGNFQKMMGRKASVASLDIGGQSVLDAFLTVNMSEYLPKSLPKTLSQARRKAVSFAFKQIPSMLKVTWDPQRYLEQYKRDDEHQAREHQKLLSREFQTLQEVVDEAMNVNLTSLMDQVAAIIFGARLAKMRISRMFKKDNVEDLLTSLEMALPGNKTADMGRMMYELAKQPEIRETENGETFLQKLQNRDFPEKFLNLWDEFIAKHGFRGMGELELSTPRSHADLPALFAKIKDMSEQVGQGGRSVFEIAKEKRENAYRQLHELAAKKGKRAVRKLEKHYAVFLAVAGLRENPKYNLIRAMDLVHRHALRFGEMLTQDGRLDRPEDIFSLKIDEADRALHDKEFDLRAAIEKNTAYARQLGKRDIPVLFDSRGKIFRPPPRQAGENTLAGEPISPGVTTGIVKVLRTAHEKPIHPGEILVAKATDPGWTPLFINAGAIILENGGTLQHGAVVAREYGKPCVSSVVDATQILKDGQLIEVDGSNGLVKVLG